MAETDTTPKMAQGLFALFSGMANADPRAHTLAREVQTVEAVIRPDWYRRVYGDGTYVGYKTLRDFYKGRQWSYVKDAGGTMRTYNYCFTIVENMTAFLSHESPQMSSPPRKLDNVLERALAEGRTKILQAVHEDNGLGIIFQTSARTASLNGDAFIYGAIPTFKTNDKGEKVFDRIRYWNVERPETIRVIWKDDNYREIAGFIRHYRIAVSQAERLFAEEIAAGKIRVQADKDTDNISPNPDPTDVPMLTVKEYWDESEYLLMFNADNKPVYYAKHDWGFVPLHYIPNIHLPGEPRGTSDLENELDAQQEYNERASDLADIIKEMAQPTYWGKNLDNLTEVRSGQKVIYDVGSEGEIQAMPRSGQTVPVEQYLQDRKNDIIGLSGLNNVLYPGNQVLQATGRALSVIMQGVNNKIANRKAWWEAAFKELNKQILYHAEQHVEGAAEIIGGWYKTDVFISSVLLRSVTDEINKFNAKIQSLTTTQQNVGISNPSEEQKLMKEELQDEILATEISKQPALLHQILAERTAAAQAENPDYAGGGTAPAGGGGGSVASESDNAAGGNPAPAPGTASPVSPGGAARMQASRSGAPAAVVARK